MTDPNEFPDLTKQANAALTAALATLPTNVGAALLFAFDYGEGKGLSWVSSAEREDMLVMLLEWLSLQPPEMLARASDRHLAEKRKREGR